MAWTRWDQFWWQRRQWFRRTWMGKLYWWVRHRTINRYHVLPLNIEPGWYDQDTRMIYACFACLEYYVEKERDGAEDLEKWIVELRKPTEATEAWMDEQYLKMMDESNQYQADYEAKVLALYYWWKVYKQGEGEWIEDETGDLKGYLISDSFDQVRYDLENQKLKELIDLRGGLWT